MILKIVLFWLFALLGLVGALAVVLAKHPLRAGLGLLANFVSIGLIYLLLKASFLAMAQIIVYAGGVAVFILMAINLMGLKPFPGDRDLSFRGFVSILITIAMLMGTLGVLYFATLPQGAVADVGARTLGATLLGPFLLPFEVASVLLVVGLVAAVAISRSKKEDGL